MKTFKDFGIELGSKTGTEVKVICPQCSAHRKKKTYPCLNVNTEKGVWNCWHCTWSGTLKDGEWKRPEIIKAYVKPAFVRPAADAESGVTKWLAKRGIDAHVMERNKITKGSIYFPQIEEERDCILFPYYRGDEVVNIKYRSRDKLFRMAAGAERILYGINDIAETLIWVEGEIDKLSIEMAGFTSCVSVPDGAPAPDTKNYSNKFEYLQDKALDAVKKHIIAVDNDGPGKKLQEELVRRLGAEKCLLAVWPEGCKDANDVLVKYGADEVDACLANAQPVPIQGAYRVADMYEELRKEYEFGTPKGLAVGWDALEDLYRVLEGEWTLVTGIAGDGKSEWLDALTINLAKQYGWSFGVFSPENQPLTYHVRKIAEKYAGKPHDAGPTERMTKDEYDAALGWINEHYIFINPELPTIDELLTIAKGLVLQQGIRGLIIDPWNEIDHARATMLTETEHISQCLTKIRTFARNYGVHVWVVAHPTKLLKVNGIYPVPTPYDVAGSAHWRNKADNCITVYRDQKGNTAEVQIHIQKIRKKANGKVGMATLLYDRVTGQYRDERPSMIPKHFAQKMAVAK